MGGVWDIILGSQGCALSSNWCSACYAHLENHCTTTSSVHWATIMAAKENPCNIIIMILHHKDWNPPPQLDLANHSDIHTIGTIPSNAVRYPSAPQWPSYYNQFEISLTSIMCIHSQNSPPTHYTLAPWLQQIIQEPHNLHIPTHNPTLIINLYKHNISDKCTNSPKTSYPLRTPPLAEMHQIPIEFYTPNHKNTSHSKASTHYPTRR